MKFVLYYYINTLVLRYYKGGKFSFRMIKGWIKEINIPALVNFSNYMDLNVVFIFKNGVKAFTAFVYKIQK